MVFQILKLSNLYGYLGKHIVEPGHNKLRYLGNTSEYNTHTFQEQNTLHRHKRNA